MFWHLYAEEQTVGRCPMVLSMSVSMVTAGAASTLIQGTAAAATPPATAGIVFDGDEGRLSEAAFLRDFAGDLPEAKAKVLYAVQEEADRKQCPRRFRRAPRGCLGCLYLRERQPG